MTTVHKKKDAEKAALQKELKYYSGLLAAHYSSAKIQSQHPNVQSLTRNSAIATCGTLKTTTNCRDHYKSTSFQHRAVTHFPNQNSKVTPSVTLQDLPKRIQVSNSSQLKYPCKSSMVKVSPSALSGKVLNHTRTIPEPNKLLKKNLPGSKEQMNHAVLNKPSGSNSQKLMDELSVLINQLKQKTKHVDNKISHVSAKAHLINKCILDKSKLKVSPGGSNDSKIFCNNLNNSQNINLKNKNCNIFPSGNFSLPLSKCSNDGKKGISQTKPMNDSLVKPLRDLRNNFNQSKHEMVAIAGKPCNETSQNLCAKYRNLDVLPVNNTIKTPVRKKLTRKCPNSGKKLNATTLFASKYKVVNKKILCVEQGKKVTVVSPEVKTTLKIKPLKKHINSVKKIRNGARLITTKYKIINKKLPSVQSNPEYSFQRISGDNSYKLSNNKRRSLKTNEMKMKVNKVNSKYKIVNRNEISVTVPMSLFAKKNITKETKVSNFAHQGGKNLNKFKTSSSRKSLYTTSKLPSERKIVKNMVLVKKNHINILNLKRKKLNPSRNSFMSNSKYRTVNKLPSSTLKKKSEKGKTSNLNSDLNSNIDLDLLMELAAEKKEGNNNPITNSPSKHILIKRVYKSKNAIVNKNVSSLQTKAAKMIKTKYSILNKKHSWQKPGFTKRLMSPRCFKGHKFNSKYGGDVSFCHRQKNKRNNSRHVSTYFVGRSYSRNYLGSKNKSIPVGPLGSMVKTPKRFVVNRKVYMRTPNISKLNSPVSKTMASRALNRSINRVLNASLKKKTSKVNIYCMFYNRFGRCNKGLKCPYVHDPRKIAVCTRFLRGTCKTENCPFSHEICPGKMAICSFFLLGSCTKTNCPYRHETLSPNAKLCKAFVEGYCPDGKQCTQAHVLVCPQFVQGHCEKGKTCPFPHPPPKGKKTIPNLSEKSENLEETGELILEKMARYFECGNELETNDNSNVNSIAVPRIRNLPEQPSFIAL